MAEVRSAASSLALLLGRPVEAVILGADVALDPGSDVAAYLLAEGAFYSLAVEHASRAITAPLGDHPAIVGLIWQRYDEALGQAGGA